MAQLVLVHGILGSATNWGPVQHRLSAHLPEWEILAVDLLGHGRRAQPQEPEALTSQRVADDLHEQLRALRRPEVPLFALGHSFGLRPLLKISTQSPDFFSGVIAEDSAPEISEQGFEAVSSYLIETPTPFASREEAREYFEQRFPIQPAMARFLLSQVRELRSGQHSWRFDRDQILALLKESREESLWSAWAEFPGPMSMVLGGSGSFVTPERLNRARQLRQNRRLSVVQVDQSGHWVHSEQAQIFCEVVSKQLKQWLGE